MIYSYVKEGTGKQENFIRCFYEPRQIKVTYMPQKMVWGPKILMGSGVKQEPEGEGRL